MTNLIHNICPACGCGSIANVLSKPNFPAILFPINLENRFSVTEAELFVLGCKHCDHLFLSEIDEAFNKKLYEDFYYLYPYSNLESMQDAYRKPFEKVFNFFTRDNLTNQSLLEIGCSSEDQLNFFRKKGFSCTGISPGINSSEDTCLIDGFYESTPFVEKYNYIVSRFNLEHIINLKFFLDKVSAELTDDGLFFVQVPNTQAFLFNGVFGIYAHEHPQYFSKKSLCFAIERSGLELQFLQADISDPSIILVAKKRPKLLSNLDLAPKNLERMDDVIGLLEDQQEISFVFYGAGLSLCSLLYLDRRLINFQDRIIIVDDNPMLSEKYMPNTDLKIQALSSIGGTSEMILLVLLNPVYHRAVLTRISSFSFKKIYCIDATGLKEFT